MKRIVSLMMCAAAVCLYLLVAVYAQQPKRGQAKKPPVPAGDKEPADNPFRDPELLPAGSGSQIQIDPKVYTWSAGQEAVKMIHRSEGFCLLTSVEGKLDSAKDKIRVYLAEDGFWYLQGTADKGQGVSGSAMAIRFVAAAPKREEEAVPDLVVPPISPERAETTEEPEPAPKVRDEGKRVEVRLPAPLDQLAVGAGGDYLVLRLPKLQKLAIFDTRKLKVFKYVSAPEDALFAAGREKLVVLNVKQSILQRYDLATGERELSITSPVSNAGAMVMGAASEGPVLVRLGGDDLAAGSGLVFIDLRSLKKLPVTMEDQGGFGGGASRMWASLDGKTFGFQRERVSPSGLTVLSLQGSKARIRYAHESVGHVMPSADGRVLLTSQGLFNSDLQPLGRERREEASWSYLSCPHAAYYVGISNSGQRAGGAEVAIFSISDRQKLLALPSLPELQPKEREFYAYRDGNLDERLQVLPTQQRLITIPPEQDRIIGRKFDLNAELKAADVDYLFVASLPPTSAEKGKPYAYALQTESRRGQVTYKLESGPEGMTISPAGEIKWTPPADFNDGEVGVIVAVKDASGQETFHAFVISMAGKGGEGTSK